MNKKIVIWCGDAANQKALANKIAKQFPVCGIVIDKKKNFKKKSLLKRLLPALQDRFFFRSVVQAWTSLQHDYSSQYSGWPDVPVITVDTINSDEAFHFTKKLSPDLVVVSGTGLVKSAMLSLCPPTGIINLHTGLSPYIKGGPNCTNWCISTRQYEKIGNTIMWINEGIDAGNIIASECTPLAGASDLREVQWKVMEHAHQLYLRVIHYLFFSQAPYQSIPQKQVAAGKLYLTRMWNFAAKKTLLNNLPVFLKKIEEINYNEVVTVPVKEEANAR